ncbi:hypothetical protein MPSEU_000618500 [Mayamaea pseudoterrestris]|nr:hypothetical protein MPSEU_000618500 [Mayamaea pseudoterrestris]
MTKFLFLLTLAAFCCISIYQTEINWQGKQDLKTFMRAYFDDENLVCRHVLSDSLNATKSIASSRLLEEPSHTQYIVNVTIGCRALFENAGLGTGNFMAGMYAMRLAARALSNERRSVDMLTSCHDAHREQANLILPWLMGTFGGAAAAGDAQFSDRLAQQYINPASFQDEACSYIDKAPIGQLYPEMQYELRRMAVTLIGIPPVDHSMYQIVKQWVDDQRQRFASSPFFNNQYALNFNADAPPLYNNVSLDDAILHFRCGDLMDSNHPRFGFLRFHAFAKHIPLTAKSIGIVTQPFSGSLETVRALDASETKRQRCRVVVTELISYLQARFPNARVQLHNSPDETIALTYARMILAQATIAGISTFGVFASIASFGTGYIRRPDEQSATNEWLVHPKPLDEIISSDGTLNRPQRQVQEQVKQLVLMDELDILMVRRVRELWLEQDGEQKIVKWFRGDD